MTELRFKGKPVKRIKLVNAEEIHKQYPKSFEIPDKEDLDDLKIGDSVKVNKEPGERFWVEIVDIKPDYYLGEVDNEIITGDIEYGDIIKFQRKNIYSIRYPMLRDIDKVESGDWIVIQIPFQIIDILENALIVKEIETKRYAFEFYSIKNMNGRNEKEYIIWQQYIPIPIKKIADLEKGKVEIIPLKVQINKKNKYLYTAKIDDLIIEFGEANIIDILKNKI